MATQQSGLPLKCLPHNSRWCSAHLEYAYATTYDTPGDSTEQKDKAAFTLLGLGNSNTTCSHWATVICLTLFPRCGFLDDTVLRAPICLNECQAMDAQCTVFGPLSAFSEHLTTQCDKLRFPDAMFLGPGYVAHNNETVVVDSITYTKTTPERNFSTTMQCTASQRRCNTMCTPGLVLHGPSDAYGCATCAGSCPPAIYSPERRHTLTTLWDTGAWINFCSALFMLFMWMGQPKRRQFPSRFIIFFSICLLLMSIAMTFGSLRGHDNMQCANPGEWQSGKSDALCMAQAMLWIVGILGMTGWWLAFCVALYLLIYKQMAPMLVAKHERKFHVVVWSVPLLVALLVATAADVGYDPGGLTCFISTRDQGTWQIVFWVPLCLMVAVGTCLMVRLTVEVCKSSRRTKMWQSAKTLSRFFAFIPLYWCLVIAYLVFSLDLVSLPSRYLDGIAAYPTCVVRLAGNIVPDDSRSQRNYEQCRQENLYVLANFGFDLFMRLLLSIVGLVVVLVFGLQKTNGHWWHWLARRCTRLTTQSFTEWSKSRSSNSDKPRPLQRSLSPSPLLQSRSNSRMGAASPRTTPEAGESNTASEMTSANPTETCTDVIV